MYINHFKLSQASIEAGMVAQSPMIGNIAQD